MEYTLGLAVEDFVPVFLSSYGLFHLSRLVSELAPPAGTLARAGWIITTLGGLSKATWKLIIATTGDDVVWLANGLFVGLGPGFLCMAVAMWQARRAVVNKPATPRPWALPFVVSASFLGASAFLAATREGRAWSFVLLGLTVLGSNATGIIAAGLGCRRRDFTAASLFGVNLVASFILARLARIDPQTVPLQWFEQMTNTIAQAGFAYASVRVLRLHRVTIEAPR